MAANQNSQNMKKPIVTRSDKLLLKEIGKVGADEIVDSIAISIPGINIAYKLVKAYLGKGMKLRQQRVLNGSSLLETTLANLVNNYLMTKVFKIALLS